MDVHHSRKYHQKIKVGGIPTFVLYNADVREKEE